MHDCVVDFWTNVRSPRAAEKWRDSRLLRQSIDARGGGAESYSERGLAETLADMAAARIDMSVVTGSSGLAGGASQDNYTVHDVLEWCRGHSGQLRAGMTIDNLDRIGDVCRLVEDLAPDPSFVVVRVISIFLREPINSPRLYPVYERCEALGLPVSVNVGVPGPRTRTALQEPILLDDVLIDFPDLVVVASHMGHPWESLLIRFMRKYENLYLSNSAWLAKYLDPNVISFMNSSVGATRLIFASDAPFMSPQRAIEAARQVPITADAMRGFLGGNAVTALGLLPDGRVQRCER